MKILLVRLREIGDVVFTTPAIRALRQRFPDAHIAYLVEPRGGDVIRSNPHVDELIVAPRGDICLRTSRSAAGCGQRDSTWPSISTAVRGRRC